MSEHPYRLRFREVILERLRATNAMIDLLRHAPGGSERRRPATGPTASELRQQAITQLRLEPWRVLPK